MLQRVGEVGVAIRLGITAEAVHAAGDHLRLKLRLADGTVEETEADHIFNCGYTNINYLLANSGIDPIPLKHELTEMCIVNVPEEIRGVGITVMCGPFFSVMPFPPLGQHSFSHVRYTPHYEWNDKRGANGVGAPFYDPVAEPSAWEHMRRDAARYIPILGECRYERSLWEIKTVLPRSETDDSRPILFRADHGLRGLHCILGGKIDNIYDAINAIESGAIFK